MRKSCLSILAVLVLLTQAQSYVERNTILKWQKGLVLVNYHGLAETSGFFISEDGIIVTTFHLIKGWIFFVDGFHVYVATYEKEKPYKAEVLGFNRMADLLFLKIKYKPEVWFNEFEQAKNGQKCVALGFPYGWRTGIEAKIIVHYKYEWLGIDRIPLKGASGSLIISEDGKVLGMLTKQYGLGFIVPSVLIRNGLMGIRKANEQR